ncbi:hypothetical protein GCM10019016_010730 [Streptomyces prasinosporus]|uniref:P-type ATPase A domain-containing protein n=1 Tax=Streptomyces prasinosporus TaxID=68256 RepID=A0ABP6TGR5_9ACTN|nr:hypothetical protein GCM10010332_73770 [Streptomyces albogriseolus]
MPFSLVPTASDGVAHICLEAAVGVPLFVLAGWYLEARARRGTGEALRSLAELAAKEVAVRDDTGERRIAIDDLRAGQILVVRPGERVATDGTVVEGSSAIDLSLVTGESEPAEVGPGTIVIGGSVNVGGLLTVRASRVSAPTPDWPASPTWSPRHRRARRGHSASPTRSPESSYRSYSPWPPRSSASGSARAPNRRPRSPPPWPSWSSPIDLAIFLISRRSGRVKVFGRPP